MVSDSQRQLVSWVRSVSDAQISFGPPPMEPPTGNGVSIYLLDMRGRLPLSPARPDRQQLELGYLVTAWSEEPAQAQQLLVDLCFAAFDQPAMEVDLEPPGVALWRALGVSPQPSFRVRLAVRRLLRDQPILQPLSVESAAPARLTGVVLTSGDRPVPEARVEVPSVGRQATTDRRGVFRIDGVPRNGGPLRVRVRARGQEVTREIGPEAERSFVVLTLNVAETVDG